MALVRPSHEVLCAGCAQQRPPARDLPARRWAARHASPTGLRHFNLVRMRWCEADTIWRAVIQGLANMFACPYRWGVRIERMTGAVVSRLLVRMRCHLYPHEMLILYNETRKIFIIQERERGIIVVNIVPEENPPKNTDKKNTIRRPTKIANAQWSLHSSISSMWPSYSACSSRAAPSATSCSWHSRSTSCATKSSYASRLPWT